MRRLPGLFAGISSAISAARRSFAGGLDEVFSGVGLVSMDVGAELWRNWVGDESMMSPQQVDAARREPARLLAVRDSRLVDSPEEEAFDALTRLAAGLIQVPVSFISVVDADRDYYKSHCGLTGTVAETRQLSGRTFCHFALLSKENPLIIRDTHADPVWASVPTVASLGVRAYVGAPMRLDGHTIGSFCVVDQRPRAWTALQLQTLRELAASAIREVRLRKVTREAMECATQAEAAVRANHHTQAVIAHDLRTPLQVLRLGVALLQEQADADALRVTARMTAAISAITDMIDDLRSSTAISVGTPGRREPVAALRLMQDVLDTMQPIAQRAGQRLEAATWSCRGEMYADYSQLLRVFCNLIGNSVKYGRTGGRIALSATLVGDDVVWRVEDDGLGMGAEDAARAFEPGFRANSGAPEVKGDGLGLAIVRALVEQHGGRVQLSSMLGAGTVVTVWLPRFLAD